MPLDPAILARIQFGFTIGFHILFPTLTIGLAWFLAVLGAMHLKTGNPVYRLLYRFWVKLFALGFGVGVVSGVFLSYQFGTNFSRFSQMTGPVLGPLLSAEVLTAFFVEAGFIGVMLFGWDKVGPRLHFVATLLVAIGTLNSAFWILVANSWMHTPAGTELIDGRFVVQDWWAVIFNPSMPYRIAHMVAASFLTAALVVAGVSALWLLRGAHAHAARRGLAMGLGLAALLAPLQVFIGDQHGLNVREHQPVKVAAMEGLWRTTRCAPLLLFAWPDQAAQENRFEIAIPCGASLILTHDPNGEVQGLVSVAPADQPPVAPVFFAFRIMVGLGFWMLALAWAGAFLLWRGRAHESRWLLRACVLSIPAGFVATLAGWIVAEMGRQPWTVYRQLRTADSLSPVVPAAVATTLAVFVVLYTLLLIAFLWYAAKLVRIGPETPEPAHPPAAMRGARPGLAGGPAE
jgi:cytochrome d ubiquinol oxidase subunit I